MCMVMKSNLKAEAERIIGELGLLDLLSRYGKAGVVGSVAYDLIVKLDIDIHLLIPEGIDLLNTVDSIYHQLLDREHVHEVRISDYREDHAIKIGIDRYTEKSGDWSIDIWVTDRTEETAFEYVDQVRKMLRPEHRKAILAIKEYCYELGQLRDGMSVLIYGAVIDNDVRTVEEFKRFLAGKEASLRQ